MSTHAAVDMQSQTATIIAIAIVFASASTAIVLLRLKTRSSVVKAIGPDDLMIAIAQVLAIATSVATILEAKFGLGRHTWTVQPGSTPKQLESLYSVIMIYNPAQIIVKASFLFQYRRLFTGDNTRRVCLWLLVFIVIWGITQELLLGLSCVPLSIIIPSMAGRCINTLPIWYLTSTMNIVTDFIILIVPLPSIVKLQLVKKQKFLLIGLFCLGFFTCVISLIRISTLRIAIDTTDPMWDNAPAAYWTIIELNCGILCASLPTLRPLLRKYFPTIFSSNTGNSAKQSISATKKSHGDAVTSVYSLRQIRSSTELKASSASICVESVRDERTPPASTYEVAKEP